MSQLDREGAERGPHDPLRSFPTPCFVTLRCHHRCRTSYWAILVAASGVDCRVLHLGSPRTKTGLPWWLSGKESACQCRRLRRCGFHPWVRNIHWRRKWQPTPVCLPGKSHGQGSLVGYSPWGHKESDTTEYSHIHTGLIVRCIIILCSTKKLKMLTNVIVRCHQL